MFKLLQPDQVTFDLAVGPAGQLAELTATKQNKVLFSVVTLADVTDQGLDMIEQTPRLRRQLVKRAAKQFRGDTVCKLDIIKCDADELPCFAGTAVGSVDLFTRSLMLMQQRDCIDQGEIFLVVPACACTLGRKREFIGIRVHHVDRLQKPLSVAQ